MPSSHSSGRGGRSGSRGRDEWIIVGILLISVTVGVIAGWQPRRPRDTQRHGQSQASVNDVRGRVVDSRSGRGIPAAVILVRSNSPPVPMPFHLLQGTQYRSAIGTSDSSGTFSIPFKPVGSVWLSAVAPDHVTIVNQAFDSSSTILSMRRSSATARPIIDQGFSVPMGADGHTDFLDLDVPGVTLDSMAAELALVVKSYSNLGFELRPVGRGGIRRIDQRGPWGTWEAGCEAPEELYVDHAALLSSQNMFYVFSTRNQLVRYGRLGVDLAVPRPGVHGPKGDRGRILIRSSFNPTGGREVCAETPAGESAVLKEIAAVGKKEE